MTGFRLESRSRGSFSCPSCFYACAPVRCKANQGNRVIFFLSSPTLKCITEGKVASLWASRSGQILSHWHEWVKTGTAASVKWAWDFLSELHVLWVHRCLSCAAGIDTGLGKSLNEFSRSVSRIFFFISFFFLSWCVSTLTIGLNAQVMKLKVDVGGVEFVGAKASRH